MVRTLMRQNEDSLVALVERLVGRIRAFFTTDEKAVRTTNKALLNCVRLLTRLLPFCFESEALSMRVTRLLCPVFNVDADADWVRRACARARTLETSRARRP